jgi:hypothetical protein
LVDEEISKEKGKDPANCPEHLREFIDTHVKK